MIVLELFGEIDKGGNVQMMQHGRNCALSSLLALTVFVSTTLTGIDCFRCLQTDHVDWLDFSSIPKGHHQGRLPVPEPIQICFPITTFHLSRACKQVSVLCCNNTQSGSFSFWNWKSPFIRAEVVHKRFQLGYNMSYFLTWNVIIKQVVSLGINGMLHCCWSWGSPTHKQRGYDMITCAFWFSQKISSILTFMWGIVH